MHFATRHANRGTNPTFTEYLQGHLYAMTKLPSE